MQTVKVHRQTITNSCGLHTAVNLFALNKNPKYTNITGFGRSVEDGIKNMKKVNLPALKTDVQQINLQTFAKNLLKTAPFRQM